MFFKKIFVYRKLFLFTAFLFAFNIFLFSKDNPRLFFSVKGGYSFLLYDEEGDSFKLKKQEGGGFNFSLDLFLNKYFGLGIELPGLYYFLSSDSLGGYIYPGKMNLPFSFFVEGILPLNKFSFYLKGGYSVGYFFVFSHYYPRRYLSGIFAEMGINYSFFDERLLMGIGFLYKPFFVENADRLEQFLIILSVGGRFF